MLNHDSITQVCQYVVEKLVEVNTELCTHVISGPP